MFCVFRSWCKRGGVMLWRKFTPRAISYRILRRKGQPRTGYISFCRWKCISKIGRKFASRSFNLVIKETARGTSRDFPKHWRAAVHSAVPEAGCFKVLLSLSVLLTRNHMENCTKSWKWCTNKTYSKGSMSIWPHPFWQQRCKTGSVCVIRKPVQHEKLNPYVIPMNCS